MRPEDIKKGRSYINKSGRSERKVLHIGADIKVRWSGSKETEPVGEPGVLYVDTRMGKTFYGESSGKRPMALYLSAFAAWAKSEVPEGQAAPSPVFYRP